jgi:hypothetical protein
MVKIRSVHTPKGISFYAVNTLGSAKIGDQPLSTLSIGKEKAELIKKLYEDGGEYDPVPFMNSLIALKNVRITRFVTQAILDNWLKDLKKILKTDGVEK